MSRKRVLLADDHAIFHEGLAKLLSPTYDIVGRVADGRALVEAAAELMPDLVVADISMPELNGIEAIREMKAAGADAKVVLLTMHEDPEYAIEALNAGALDRQGSIPGWLRSRATEFDSCCLPESGARVDRGEQRLDAS